MLRLPVGGTARAYLFDSGDLQIANAYFCDCTMITLHKLEDTDYCPWVKLVIEGPCAESAAALTHTSPLSTVELFCQFNEADPSNCISDEWEWKNPPMEAGVEYRTTERWKGSPVYTQVVYFGTLPNNTVKKMQVYYGANSANGLIHSVDIISITSHVHGDTDDKEWTSLPFIYGGSNLAGDMYYRDDSATNGLTVRTQRDLSKYHALFTVKYTKEHA
jgi:hypothetical protein